jgi:hypothetical protein
LFHYGFADADAEWNGRRWVPVNGSPIRTPATSRRANAEPVQIEENSRSALLGAARGEIAAADLGDNIGRTSSATHSQATW